MYGTVRVLISHSNDMFKQILNMDMILRFSYLLQYMVFILICEPMATEIPYIRVGYRLRLAIKDI
jgi:hypothetical protein